MKNKLFALILSFLIFFTQLIPHAFAATTYFYVDRGVGSPGNGTSWAQAENSIDAAIGDIGAATDVEIRVAPGTYDLEPSNRISVDSRTTGKKVVIKRYVGQDGSAAYPTQTIGDAIYSSTNSYAVWLKTTALAGTFTWDGINISSTQTYPIFRDTGDSTGTYTFQNMSITTSLANGSAFYMDGNGYLQRTVVFDNVTFTGNIKWLSVNSFKKLWVKNCTFTHTSDVPDAGLITFGFVNPNLFYEAIFENNTFTVPYYSNTRAIFNTGTGYSGTVFLKNNTFTSTSHAVLFIGTALQPGLKLIAMDNTFYMQPDGTASHDATAIYLGYSDYATNWLSAPIILRNKFYCSTNASGHTAAVFTGPAAKGGLVAFNSAWGFDQAFYAYGDFATYIFNEADGADGLIIEAGEPIRTATAWATGVAYALGNQVVQSSVIYQCLSAHTSGTFATDLAAGKWGELPKTGRGNVYMFNSIYADDKHPTTGTGGAICLRDGYTNAAQPTENVFLHNVIHASQSSTNTVAISAHTGTMRTNLGNVFDYNVYYLDGTGSGGLFVKDTVQSDSRNPLAFWNWSTHTMGEQYNDVHSIIAKPNFINPSNAVTGTARNLKLPSGSAARGTKNMSNPSSTDWPDKGAWTIKSTGGSGLRR